MKKLKLDVEALEVDSFEPAAESRLRATVHGREWSDPGCQETVEPGVTCAASCQGTCRSCPADPTCGYWTCSCDTYCGTPSCVNTCGCEPY
jgi:hypothetical protein